nr:MAG TPA: hypothetical protein [Caudoviricetes sp.]
MTGGRRHGLRSGHMSADARSTTSCRQDKRQR